MDIQADHQVALIVPSEAAFLSQAVYLQGEVAYRLLHLTGDRERHRPHQADQLQEPRSLLKEALLKVLQEAFFGFLEKEDSLRRASLRSSLSRASLSRAS